MSAHSALLSDSSCKCLQRASARHWLLLTGCACRRTKLSSRGRCDRAASEGIGMNETDSACRLLRAHRAAGLQNTTAEDSSRRPARYPSKAAQHSTTQHGKPCTVSQCCIKSAGWAQVAIACTYVC
jgi:hypothetical protein